MRIHLTPLIMLVFVALFMGCRKKGKESSEIIYGLPELSTNAMSSITPTSAIGGGNIVSDGNSPVIERGICWSTISGPTTAGAHASVGSGSSGFSYSIIGLQPGTIYYVRAYAINQVGTAYGNEITFKTASAWYVAKQTFQYSSLYSTPAGLYGYNENNVGIGFSYDNGNTWTSITGNTLLYSTSELVQHGSYLFAVGNGGVFRTTNNGISWAAMNNGLPSPLNVNCIASNGSDLFIANNTSGIFKSSDNGVSWTPVNTGINLVSGNQCRRLRFHGSTLFAGFGNGIYKTVNNGVSWTLSTNLPSPNYIRDFLSSGNTFFAAYSSSGLMASADGGGSWSSSLATHGGAYSLTEDNNNVYCCFDGGVLKQAAGTTNWTDITLGLTPSTNKFFNTITVKGNYLFVIEVKTSPMNFALYKYPLQ